MDKKEPKSKEYVYAVGRRKTAVAQVRLIKGTGIVKINEQDIKQVEIFSKPLQLSGLKGKFDIFVKVKGGGKISQADAINLGVARALVKSDDNLRLTLKKSGLLTRDPREKERKKYGLKRARKAPQWSKR